MKILIPVDGSDCANATIGWAIATLAHDTNEYLLLSVVSDPMIAEYEIEDATSMLREARNRLQAPGCKVVSAEYVHGDPGESICRYAEDKGVDQVLIGSHGRSGLAKMFLGSVSEYVLEHCLRPVFLYQNVTRDGHPTRKSQHVDLTKTML